MGFSDILLKLVLLLAPSVKGLYYEQEMFVFQTVIFIAFAAFLAKNRRIGLNRTLDFAVLTFLAAYLFTLPGAADFREALLAVMRLIAYFMIYLMVAAKARDNTGRLYILRTVYLSGGLMVAVTLLNLTGTMATSDVWDSGIILTTFEYKNAGALFLLVCTLIGVYLGQQTDSVKISALIGAGNYLNLLMIIGTQSRAVWVLAPVAYIFMLPGLPVAKRGSATFRIMISLLPAILISNKILALLQEDAAGQAVLWVVSGAVLAAAGIIGWLWLESRLATRRRLFQTMGISTLVAFLTMAVFNQSILLAKIQSISWSSYSVQERLVFFKDAWKIISDHPFFGTGGRGWDILYLNIQSYGYYAENIHNDFLQVAVEAGFFGLLTFTLIWVVFFLTCWRIHRRSASLTKEIAWLVLIVGVTIMLHALFDFDLAHSALAFVLWSLLGITRAMEGEVREKSFRLPSSAFIAVLVAGILYSAVSLSFFTGNIFFAKGEKVLAAGDLITTREYFLRAQAFDPWKTNTLVSLAQINLAIFEGGNPGALDQVLYYAEKAIRARPNEPLSHSVYATALFYKGDYLRSAAATEKYVALHPMLLTAYEELAARYVYIGIALKGQGAHREARDFFDKTINVGGMIENRLKEVSSREIDLWRAKKADSVLAVTPRLKMYTGAAQLLLGNTTRGRDLIMSAAQEEPANPELMMWHALVLDIAGRQEQARGLLEQAAAQNSGVGQNYEKVRELIKRTN